MFRVYFLLFKLKGSLHSDSWVKYLMHPLGRPLSWLFLKHRGAVPRGNSLETWPRMASGQH